MLAINSVVVFFSTDLGDGQRVANQITSLYLQDNQLFFTFDNFYAI